MPKLPNIRPKQLVKLLQKHNYVKHRQKGSHLILVNKNKNKQITVAMHNETLKKGTLAAILRQIEMSFDELNKKH